MAYSDKVLDHYNNPRNVGSLRQGRPRPSGRGVVGAPECGDVMKLQIQVNPDTGVIEDAKFKTFGCGSAIASSAASRPSGSRARRVDEAEEIKNTEIVEELRAAAGQDPLLRPGRGRHQGGHRRLPGEAGPRSRRRLGRRTGPPSRRRPVMGGGRARSDPRLTERAGREPRQAIVADQPSKLPRARFLRVGVKGGGCSGFSYSLELRRRATRSTTRSSRSDGVDVVVDVKSYPVPERDDAGLRTRA